MNRPLVSVIIPAYNRASLIEETLASVTGQSWQELEIIVVDDGSTDATAEIVRERRSEDERISIVSQRNQGVAAARQAGFMLSRGDLIQYLDSDDLLDRWKVERQANALILLPEYGLAYGPMFHLLDGKVSDAPARHTGAPIATLFPAMLKERLWDTGSALIRRSVCENVGPWSNLHFEEDWEFDARIARLGTRALYVPDAYSYYRLRDSGASTVSPTLDGLRSRARAHALILEHARAAEVVHDSPEMHSFSRSLFLLARQCAAAGLTLEAREMLALSTSIVPGGDTRLYRLLSSIAGWKTIGKIASWSDRFR